MIERVVNGNTGEVLVDYTQINVKTLAGRTITEITEDYLTGIAKIGRYAFHDCDELTKIELPDTLIEIEEHAFDNCSKLSHICLGTNLTTIGSNAFYGCKALESIEIPDTCADIATDAFEDCDSLREIKINSTNPYFTSVDGVIYNKDCSKVLFCPPGLSDTIVIPEGVTTIPNDLIRNNSVVKKVHFPSTITQIPDTAFKGCESIDEIHFTDINVWLNLKFDSLTAHPFCTSGSGKVFVGANEITQVTIPSTWTELKNYTFCGCSGLTKITIPASITKINKGLTYLAGRLDIQFLGKTPPASDYSTMIDQTAVRDVIVPDGSKATYLEAKGFKYMIPELFREVSAASTADSSNKLIYTSTVSSYAKKIGTTLPETYVAGTTIVPPLTDKVEYYFPNNGGSVLFFGWIFRGMLMGKTFTVPSGLSGRHVIHMEYDAWTGSY